MSKTYAKFKKDQNKTVRGVHKVHVPLQCVYGQMDWQADGGMDGPTDKHILIVSFD